MHARSLQLLTAALGALMLCALGTGCVQRRMIVRSNPPGAVVFVDNYEIGTTPCATDFIYYGTREVTLKMEGFETLTVLQPIKAPWYEYLGFDFVSENLVPGTIRDTRVLQYDLKPLVMVPPQDLVSRADTLRRNSHAGQIQPAGLLAPQTAPQFAPPITPLNPQLAPPIVQPGAVAPPGYLPPPQGYPQLQPVAPEQVPIPPAQPIGR